MVSKCPFCGKNFKTVKGMRIHKANCPKKDPYERMEDSMNKQFKKIGF